MRPSNARDAHELDLRFRPATPRFLAGGRLSIGKATILRAAQPRFACASWVPGRKKILESQCPSIFYYVQSL